MPIPAAALYGLNAALGLGGMFFGGNNPADQLRDYYNRLNSILSPQSLNTATSELYRGFIGSPAFSQAQRGLIGGANAIEHKFERANAAQGVSTGIGTTGSSLAAGAYGHGLSQLQAQAWMAAMQQAQQLLSQRASLAGGLPVSAPVTAGQRYGAIAGPFSNFLLQYLLQNQVPQANVYPTAPSQPGFWPSGTGVPTPNTWPQNPYGPRTYDNPYTL